MRPIPFPSKQSEMTRRCSHVYSVPFMLGLAKSGGVSSRWAMLSAPSLYTPNPEAIDAMLSAKNLTAPKTGTSRSEASGVSEALSHGAGQPAPHDWPAIGIHGTLEMARRSTLRDLKGHIRFGC